MAQDPKTSDKPTVTAAPADPAAQQMPQPLMTQADIALLREQDFNRARLARDDAKRAAGKKVTMVVVSPFTLVEFPDEPGRVLRAGEELEVSEYDVAAYTGRCRPKAAPGEPDQLDGAPAGPQVVRG